MLGIYHIFLFASFVASVVGLVWYMATARWWVFLLGRALVSELAGYTLISGFLSYLVFSPHRVPMFVAGIIYGIEMVVHVLLAWAIARSYKDAKKAEEGDRG